MQSPSTPQEIQTALRMLQEAFQKKLPKRIEEINAIWSQLKADENSEKLLNNLHLKLHSLTGTAATYHFDKVSTIAREGEQITKAMLEHGGTSSEQKEEDLVSALSRLNSAPLKPEQQSNQELFLTTHQLTATKANKCIYLVDDDEEFLNFISMQIRVFGYDVQIFSDLESFAAAFQNSEPEVTIMDIKFDACGKTGIEMMKALNHGRKKTLKTIFVTEELNIMSRLDSVRAGGVAYFPKPVNIGQLIDTLDRLTFEESTEPFRVLVVDDNEEQASFSELVLQQAGMETQVVTQPLQTLEVLENFLPDLILMDVYMPGCSGLELSKVIRQMDMYVSIPIVFLSAEDSLRKQLSAMSLGADDFLTKPVVPWHLVSSISNRIQRGRIIRTLAECDSLTGLLNHTSGKKRLDNEIARAKRDGNPVAYAMLDIDHFKLVNDTYGHPTGDRVLKSLSGLLRQRLRTSDSISRYGGEEFVAILPNTTSQQAKDLVDLLRNDFSAIKQQSEDGEDFFCKFSCGISCFPDYDSATELINTADKLLYEAKEQGRNRVIISSGSKNS